MIAVPALPLELGLLALLMVIAFFSGIGITAIGPGGIFLTIALYGLTTLSSNTIAGTAQVMFIGTGLIGSVAYVRSGVIVDENAKWTALLCAGSIGGALFGSWVNTFVARELFGLLLGGLAGVAGVLIIYRERRDLASVWSIDPDTPVGMASYFVLGFVLGGFSSLLGVGGPVIAVPVLVVIGVPMLPAVAAAQVQSIFIALFAAIGYVSQGAVSFPLAVALGIPLFGGVVVGWLLAHRVDPERLKIALGVVLLIVAPYLAL